MKSFQLGTHHKNQILFWLCQIGLYSNFYLLFTYSLPLIGYILLGCLNFVFLHYHFNLLHMASHGLLSKNKKLNQFFGSVCAIIGGVTFVDFSLTHTLHHAHAGKPEKDPDYPISQGHSFWLIPFKIFYHDIYFFQKGLWKKNRNWLNYSICRGLQVLLIAGFIFASNIHIFQFFWLIPILILGYCNGLFLFYFPHFSNRTEQKWRSTTKPGLIGSIGLWLIDSSRNYHEKHHEKITEHENYFPEIIAIRDTLRDPTLIKNYSGKYTDIEFR